MRAVGLEPTRSLEHGHLKPACLPVSSRPQRADRTAARPVCRRRFLPWRHPTKGATMRSAEEFNNVRQLIAAGMNDCAIARLTGIPRTTVRDWRCRPQSTANARGLHRVRLEHDLAALPAALPPRAIPRRWLHLPPPRVCSLRISHAKYPAIIERCRQAIDILMPTQRAGVLRRSDGCTDVWLYSKHWPCLFLSTVPARSTRGRFDWSPGSKRSSIRRPKSSFSVSSTATVVASSPTIAASAVSATTSRTVRGHPWPIHRRA